MARYIPPKYGPGQGGFNQQLERGHYANAAGGWVKPPKRRPLPARPRPPQPVHYVDPFAPKTDAQLQAQAGALVQQQLAPIIAQIQAAIQSRSQSGQAAISGLTQALGGLFAQAAPQTAAAYGQAQTAQSGINSALANRLGAFGQNLQGEVGNKLAYAGPSGQNVAGNVGLQAQGAANAGFAKGAAGTEMLNTQGAAAQTAAAALPGIAGLTGMQNSRNLEAQLNKELADQLGSAQSGASSSVASIYQHLLDQELQKAVASNTSGLNTKKLAADVANKKATLAYKNKTAAFNQKVKLAQLGISQQRVNETARHNGISESQAATRLINQAQSARNQNLRQKNWQVNPDGSFKTRLNKKTGKQERIPIKAPKSSKSSTGGHFKIVNGKKVYVGG